MASVTSLDKDLRKARRDKYTPAAAAEARDWIEHVLGDKLPSSDLLEGLKDGLALCRLVNLAIEPASVKFKKSAMPFVQMENISIFLRACQQPPLNLHQHDTFLTVDLYEQKDPAQVLQCIGAFSRAAHVANPSRFPDAIGPKTSKAGPMSPQATGPTTPRAGASARDRGISVTSNSSSAYKPMLPSRTGGSATGSAPGSGRQSPTKSPAKSPSDSTVSSWSRRDQEGATAPAWNIAQYGYMGGASQGNLGIAFGARRQITGAAPQVPSLAAKERARREAEAEAENERRRQQEEAERRQAQLEADEERARLEEEARWEEETRRARDEERRRADEEKRRWEEEEREWKMTEERRRKEEADAEARLEQSSATSSRAGTNASDAPRLRGQLLSQYRAEQKAPPSPQTDYGSRVKELERELELARQREAEYERERQERDGRPRRAQADPEAAARARSRARSRSRAAGEPMRQDSWIKGEREVLSTAWNKYGAEDTTAADKQAELRRRMESVTIDEQEQRSPEPTLPTPSASLSPRPLPDPAFASPPSSALRPQNTGGRPLPDPTQYSSSPVPAPTKPPKPTLTSPKPALASKPIFSSPPAPPAHSARPVPATPAPAPAPAPRASMSLLEREMDLERQRQREWEEAQRETAKAAASGAASGDGGGIGGRWDVSQWSGYTGGDGGNRGTQGIGAGRRQIVGPRPLPGSK